MKHQRDRETPLDGDSNPLTAQNQTLILKPVCVSISQVNQF